MCDTAKCRACRPTTKVSVFWPIVLGIVDVAAAGLWWLLRRVVAPGLVMLGWAAWIWFSGRTWRHRVTRRWVRREVRAAGNWAVTLVVLGFLLAPVATVIVLATSGVGLLAAASTIRCREQLLQLVGRDRSAPIRVKATVGDPRRLTHTGERG